MSGFLDKAKSFLPGQKSESTTTGDAPQLQVDPEVEDQERSHGFLKSVINPSGAEAEERYGTSSTTERAPEIPAASGTAGVSQEPADDVSKATYTERAYPLGDSPLQDRVAPLPRDNGPTGTTSSTLPSGGSSTGGTYGDYNSGRDAGIAGAGVGALGAAGAGTYAATRGGDDKPEYIRNTGPDRGNAPHVPGEFPGEDGEPSQSLNTMNQTESGVDRERYFGRPEPSGVTSPAQTSSSTTGRDAALAGGAGAVGAGAVGAVTYAATSGGSKDRSSQFSFGQDSPAHSSKRTELPDFERERTKNIRLHDGSPSLSQTSTASTARHEESHTGRNAALAGAGVAGAGAAGYGAYEMTKGQDPPASSSRGVDLPQSEKDRTSTIQTENTRAAPGQDPAGDILKDRQQTVDQRQQPIQEQRPVEVDHTARNAAIGGGAAVVAGGAGYAAYEATQGDDEERSKEAERAEKERQKDLEKQQKEREKAEKERQKENEKAEKERQKEHEKAEKERKKEEEKRQKEAEKAEKERQKEAEKREKEERKAAEKREKEEEKEREKREKEEQKLAAERQKEEERRRKEEEDHTGRNTAIAGGTAAAAGAAGYGAYEYNKDREAAPGTATTTGERTEPGYGQPHTPYSPYSAKGQQAAADAAAARDARDTRDVPSTTTTTTTTTSTTGPTTTRDTITGTQPTTREDTHYGRDAAIGAGAVGATGAGAYALSQDKNGRQLDADEQALQERTRNPEHRPPQFYNTEDTGRTHATHHHTASAPGHLSAEQQRNASVAGGGLPTGAADEEVGAYENSGKGKVATEHELEEKFATYNVHDDNPQRTQEKMEEIRRLEQEKAKYKQEHPDPADSKPKKEGFLHKILHPHSSKKHEDENQTPRKTSGTSSTDRGAGSSQVASGSSGINQGQGGSLASGLPTDEQGNIVLVNHGADPNAPHLTISEKPGGGYTTTQQ